MTYQINRFTAILATPTLLWQISFFLFPLLFLVALSFWRVELFRPQADFIVDNWVEVYGQSYFWRALLTTAIFALVTAVIASTVAFPLAATVAFRLSSRHRRLVMMALMIPFFTSYLVRLYAWQIYLGDNGIINALLSLIGVAPVHLLNGAVGQLIGYLTLTLPLATLLQIFGLSYIDKDLIKAAQNLGCGPLKALFIVAIPLAKPAFVIAALFVFILVFGDFASPIYLGGATLQTTTTLMIDLTKGGQQWPRAAVVAITMIIVLLLVTLSGLRYAYRQR